MDAIDDLSDAIEGTRNFLTQLSVRQWVTLAVVVFFVSSLGFGAAAPGGDTTMYADGTATEDSFQEEFEQLESELPVEDLLVALLVVAAVVLVLWLCYALLAGVMEFVFLESLRSEEVRIRGYFGANAGKGVRLFLFRLALLLVAGALVSAPAAIAVGLGTFDDISPGLLALYLLYGGGLYLLHSIGRRFTDEFVAPIMLLEDCGVLAAWGRFWRTLRANLAEYAVYLLLVWVLTLAVTVTVSIVIALGAVVIAIPFAIVAFVAVLAGPIGWAVAVVVGLLALAAVLLFAALVWTPVTTYFQYYALLLLGDTDPELDLVPDQRAAVRAAGTGGAIGRSDWERPDSDSSARDDDWNDESGWDGSDPWDEAGDADDADESGDSDDDDDRSW
ncbi:DUF7544 domain-containing protein [Haloterrigena alkaliphila]|uniref:Membrane domain of glycerophosphoryl diester phosphodiesterase n=1 Tax=Haloterrigena alkaliphila TaxID=2816475 RepID=A0A8A2VC18_9EURY|nr:hypothetical protein [Haloterrigena alkaliphila]QSW98257.1 hypothetical protein J0X25_12710 [Haloterrigena alkaliphila]